MTTPPSSSANEVTVYAVRRLRNAQRDDLRADWLRGQVCGFFNLPSAALFDSCTDYCIREPDRPAVDAGPAAELEELRAAAKRCRQAEHELRQAKEANDKLKAKMGELETALTQAKSDGEASIRQLKTELDDERSSVRDLIVENRDLHRRIDELERVREAALVNDLFGAADSRETATTAAETSWELSQTDHVNQRLLKSAIQFDFSRLRRVEEQQRLRRLQDNTNADDDDDDEDDEFAD
jgi:chromosome segregation ATPase